MYNIEKNGRYTSNTVEQNPLYKMRNEGPKRILMHFIEFSYENNGEQMRKGIYCVA